MRHEIRQPSLERIFGLDSGSENVVNEEDKEDNWDVATSWVSHFIEPQLSSARDDHIQVPASLSSQTIFKVMRSPCVRIIVSVIILINAVEVGVAADYKGGSWDEIWRGCDHFFTSVFALEMVLQLVALRHYYFTSGWNILDFVVAWLAIFSTWLLPMAGNPNSSMGAFRVFRLLRLLRLVKIMKIVPELMMVVEGIIASMKAMFWIFMLLLIVLYMASICCVEVIGVEHTTYPGWSDDAQLIESEIVKPFNNYLYFGSVLRSMMSLFSLVLLDEWSTIVRPVYEVQRVMLIFFVALVVLCSFGILNVIIGVVVERTTDAMNTLRMSQVEKLKAKQAKEVVVLANIMFDLDENHDNRISRDEFEKGAANPELRQIIGGIGLPAGFTFRELFQTLDVDASGWLSKGEFVEGIMRLIYNDDFQRDCVVNCAIGQLKEASVRIRTDLQAEFRTLANDLRRDFQELRMGFQIGGIRLEPQLQASREAKLQQPSAASTKEVLNLPSDGHPSAKEAEQGSASMEQDEPSISKPLATRSTVLPEAKLQDQPYTPKNQGDKAPIDLDEVSAALQPDWEPLHIMMMPKRLAGLPETSSCSVLESGGAPSLCSAEFSNQNIIGFLPIVGSASTIATSAGSAMQHGSQVQDRPRWVHLGIGQTPLRTPRRVMHV